MQKLIVVAAAALLAACETMPEFGQLAPAGGPGATASNYETNAGMAPGNSAFTPPPDQQLLELERQLSATAQARGLGGALASVMDPSEGIAVRAGATYTIADVETGLAPGANAGSMYWQPDRVHVSSSGDMGMTTGRYVQVMSGSEAVQGRYIIVWRRDAGGEWKVLTETRVADPPRTTARRR